MDAAHIKYNDKYNIYPSIFYSLLEIGFYYYLLLGWRLGIPYCDNYLASIK